MKRLVLLLLAIAAPLSAQATTHWTPIDKALVAADVAALTIDWSTTEWAVERHGWPEANPILGRHPSETHLAVYTGAGLAAFALLEAKLPPVARRVFSVTYFVIEGYTAAANLATVGPHFAF